MLFWFVPPASSGPLGGGPELSCPTDHGSVGGCTTGNSPESALRNSTRLFWSASETAASRTVFIIGERFGLSLPPATISATACSKVCALPSWKYGPVFATSRSGGHSELAQIAVAVADSLQSFVRLLLVGIDARVEVAIVAKQRRRVAGRAACRFEHLHAALLFVGQRIRIARLIAIVRRVAAQHRAFERGDRLGDAVGGDFGAKDILEPLPVAFDLVKCREHIGQLDAPSRSGFPSVPAPGPPGWRRDRPRIEPARRRR